MKYSRKDNSDIERIIKCRVNGKCKGCDIYKECRKFRKFVKEESTYHIAPTTHTSKMMNFYTKDKGGA